MPHRISRRRRLKKYSIGDMRERITIHKRTMTAPTFDDVGITQTYDAGIEMWAFCETFDRKRAVFSGVNIPEGATNSFVIRCDNTDVYFPLHFPIEFFDDDVNSNLEYIIEWRLNYYEILKISNPDEQNQYLELYSRLKGDFRLVVNS